MAQTINTNVASLTAQRNLNNSAADLNTSLQRLSSGLRINSAKDDAAGLAISERFTAQIRGLDQAGRNANDGISLAQTAEGALSEVSNNLQRIREFAVKSANATNSASDRAALQAEVGELVEEIERVASETTFNGVALLDGTFQSQTFQVGANAGQTISIDNINSARSNALGEVFEAEVDVGITGAVSGLEVNGQAVEGDSAGSLAESIRSSVPGVELEITEATVTSGAVGAASGADRSENVTINGTALTINIADGTSAEDAANQIIDSINSGDLGVVASGDETGIVLTGEDGENIVISGSATAVFTDATTYGDVSISSSESVEIGGTVTNTGLAAGVTAPTGNDGFLDTLDIGDVDGATAALATIDSALEGVSSARAELGAVQNRFESVVRSLQTTSENLSASRSRILDADFASETAALTKSQILQQAGTSILAQANSLPQNVLSLLQ